MIQELWIFPHFFSFLVNIENPKCQKVQEIPILKIAENQKVWEIQIKIPQMLKSAGNSYIENC